MKQRQKYDQGSTLVELLISATVMAIAIIAVIAVIRSGAELEVTDSHRRVARSILVSWLEENFHHNDFNTITPGTTTFLDTIEPRASAPVVGTVTVVISSQSSVVSSTSFPTFQADSKIVWQSIPGIDDSITFTKQIANIE